jgi:hypothetical protein
MSHDLFERAVNAYRNEYPGSALDARAIRRRVLARAGMRRRRRLALLRVGLPVAATFSVSVALAASEVGFRGFDDVRRWLGEALEANTATPAPARSPGSPRASLAAPALVPSPPVAAAPGEVNQVPLPPPEPRAPKPRSGDDRRRERDSRSTPGRDAAAPLEAKGGARDLRPNLLSEDLASYQRAHRLHFHGGEPAAALGAWDAYLAAYPAGTFVPEARFNRAVCLLRLGRRAEAKAVLEPIAESSFAYGRERARALLGAME